MEILRKRLLTPNDYVRDGLVLMYDGISNTRHGHENHITTWEDLSGNGYDAVCANNVTCDSDHIYFDGSGNVYFKNTTMPYEYTFANSYPASMEIVIQADQLPETRYTALSCGYSSSSRYKRFTIFPDKIAVAQQRGAITSTTTEKYISNADSSLILNSYHIDYKVNNSSQNMKAYINGVSKTLTSSAVNTQYGTIRVEIGKRVYQTQDTFPFLGKIYAIRIYNRVLSLLEIQQNLATDARRFNI